MTQKEYVSWDKVFKFIDKIAEDVKDKDISGIYGIPRGGLIFAVILSHKLNKPLLMAPTKNCIIVDDIADTGKTLLHYSDEGYYIATMFYHQQSLVVPNCYAYEKTDKWIVYPWEELL